MLPLVVTVSQASAADFASLPRRHHAFVPEPLGSLLPDRVVEADAQAVAPRLLRAGQVPRERPVGVAGVQPRLCQWI